jgi:hypothetical protein
MVGRQRQIQMSRPTMRSCRLFAGLQVWMGWGLVLRLKLGILLLPGETWPVLMLLWMLFSRLRRDQEILKIEVAKILVVSGIRQTLSAKPEQTWKGPMALILLKGQLAILALVILFPVLASEASSEAETEYGIWPIWEILGTLHAGMIFAQHS